MALILTLAMAVTLLTAVGIALYWGNTVCTGEIPVSLFTFVAIVFTSGLDVGLIMLLMYSVVTTPVFGLA